MCSAIAFSPPFIPVLSNLPGFRRPELARPGVRGTGASKFDFISSSVWAAVFEAAKGRMYQPASSGFQKSYLHTMVRLLNKPRSLQPFSSQLLGSWFCRGSSWLFVGSVVNQNAGFRGGPREIISKH